jgi:hypothetical protein
MNDNPKVTLDQLLGGVRNAHRTPAVSGSSDITIQTDTGAIAVNDDTEYEDEAAEAVGKILLRMSQLGRGGTAESNA